MRLRIDDRVGRFLGMALIIIGAILLIVSYPTGLSHLNFVLLTGLIFMLLGLIIHVWMQKRDSKY